MNTVFILLHYQIQTSYKEDVNIMKSNIKSDSLNKIVNHVFDELKNNKVDLVKAIACIAVMSYETGYNNAVEELKQRGKLV